MHSLSLALAYSKKTYLVNFSKYQESKNDQAKRCQTFFMVSHSFWNNEYMYNVAFIFFSSFIIFLC